MDISASCHKSGPSTAPTHHHSGLGGVLSQASELGPWEYSLIACFTRAGSRERRKDWEGEGMAVVGGGEGEQEEEKSRCEQTARDLDSEWMV